MGAVGLQETYEKAVARLFGGQNQKCGSHKIKTQDTNNSWVSLWARQDSNLRPNGYEPSALTTELRALRAGDRIRTGECQLGRLMPYHLATPAGFCEINFTIMGGEVNRTGQSRELLAQDWLVKLDN